MTSRKLSSIVTPSIAEIIFLGLFLFLSFSRGAGLLNDADTGYHIRAGDYILQTLSIPRHDIFSYLTPPIPWTAHEWLSEVVMAILHRQFGLTGVVVFFSLLIALTYYLLFRELRSYEGNIFIAVAITILAFASSQIHWLARPHIFSLLFMVAWYHVLDSYQCEDTNRLFLLPPLMLLWVNLHGGFITGFILLGCYVIGNFVQCLFKAPAERGGDRRKLQSLLKISIACLLVTLVNPVGYKILLFPFNLVNNKFLMDHVSEFLSPNFHEPLVFKYQLLLAIALLACSRKRPNPIELILILFFTNMALYSIRYVTLFAIIAAPILLRRADELLEGARGVFTESFRVRSARIAAMDGFAAGWLWLSIGVLVVVLCAAGGTIGYSFDPKLKPVAAVEFLKKEHIGGNMFDNDEFGDYIIYAAWPEYRVFFDGRSDMYGTERMKEYFSVTNFEPGWERVIETYRIDWFIISAKSALSRYLRAGNGWKLIYADRVAHIFVKEVPKYRYLIDRYRDVRPLPETTEKDAKSDDGA
ncbi:hypothetical protein [Pelobacter propionicus]|uniref:Glycosyltransferase RgtA/B/C/D-like domain-containing protein n=1 Tax=Pelobacter propionicus (strain DSM 2379 / NBRC 103807 / OttBd1) TaxID=338966 RepID=A1ASH7_PELPD|nr:hypothetical protein [Pelobacter propionicus]ABL00298.1 conserved hypothetical protein [Pelobacter propionicus DSM 2379]